MKIKFFQTFCEEKNAYERILMSLFVRINRKQCDLVQKVER